MQTDDSPIPCRFDLQPYLEVRVACGLDDLDGDPIWPQHEKSVISDLVYLVLPLLLQAFEGRLKVLSLRTRGVLKFQHRIPNHLTEDVNVCSEHI